jgi:SAM-dependent methyltransferase
MKNIIIKIRNNNYESSIISDQILKNIGKNAKVLDIGCGFGRNLLELRNKKIEAFGIDINESTIKENIKNGLNCSTLKDFEENFKEKYDVLLLSHIVEHFEYQDLINFIESYLKYIKPDGYILVATPLLTNYFFDDFDHVKPYTPKAFSHYFSSNHTQVSAYGKFSLDLKDLSFRRSAFRVRYCKGVYMKSNFSKLIFTIDTLYSIFFLISFKLIGKRDGWVGLYQLK